jgi:hypothetical protein
VGISGNKQLREFSENFNCTPISILSKATVSWEALQSTFRKLLADGSQARRASEKISPDIIAGE